MVQQRGDVMMNPSGSFLRRISNMRSVCHAFAAIACCTLAGCFTIVSAQQPTRGLRETPSDPKSPPRVTLGDSDGNPGGSVVVPVYFAPAEGVEVGELKLEVRFVSRNLKYSRITRGLAAESSNVTIHSELREEKNERGLEVSTLTIVASLPAPKPGQKGIPGGLLGYITLQVNEKSGPANITLRTTATATELETGNVVPNLKVIEGVVNILASGSEPLISCFFFTH